MSIHDPRIREVESYFTSQCKIIHGFDPVINWGQDGKKIQSALKVLSYDDVCRCIDWFLQSEKALKVGITISISLSGHTINSYKSAKEKPLNELFKALQESPNSIKPNLTYESKQLFRSLNTHWASLSKMTKEELKEYYVKSIGG
jgi:hypothetical protein